MGNDILEIREVAAPDTYQLRRMLLRPGAMPADLDYPGDHHALTRHVMVSDPETGAPLGVASIYCEPRPTLPTAASSAAGAASWRIRGVGTMEAARRLGVGSAMMHFLIAHAQRNGALHVWCNARIGAVAFYESLDFTTVGDEFEIAGIGPHYVMERELPPAPG